MTGSQKADTAILAIYDIFGYFPQILQGVDILAYSDQASRYQVFMPDFFEGNTANIDRMPPDNEEKQKALGEWLQSAQPELHLPKIERFLDAAETLNQEIARWVVIGYCWGGKMVSLLAANDTRLRAAVQTSPAMVDPEDAKKVKIPMMVLASGDEPRDIIEQYAANLTVPKHVEVFDGQVHGSMSARADLADVNVREQYERGYRLVLHFLDKHVG